MNTLLDQLEALYLKTSNPVYAFQALARYDLCPDDQPLPAWLMAYVRDIAMNINTLTHTESPSQALKKVNAALGLSARGRKNRFAEWRLDRRAEWADFLHGQGRGVFDPTATAKNINTWLANAVVDGEYTPDAARQWRTRGRWLKGEIK
jgi:hypothetical protein